MLLPKFLSRKISPEKSLDFLSQKSVVRPALVLKRFSKRNGFSKRPVSFTCNYLLKISTWNNFKLTCQLTENLFETWFVETSYIVDQIHGSSKFSKKNHHVFEKESPNSRLFKVFEKESSWWKVKPPPKAPKKSRDFWKFLGFFEPNRVEQLFSREYLNYSNITWKRSLILKTRCVFKIFSKPRRVKNSPATGVRVQRFSGNRKQWLLEIVLIELICTCSHEWKNYLQLEIGNGRTRVHVPNTCMSGGQLNKAFALPFGSSSSFRHAH